MEIFARWKNYNRAKTASCVSDVVMCQWRFKFWFSGITEHNFSKSNEKKTLGSSRWDLWECLLFDFISQSPQLCTRHYLVGDDARLKCGRGRLCSLFTYSHSFRIFSVTESLLFVPTSDAHTYRDMEHVYQWVIFHSLRLLKYFTGISSRRHRVNQHTFLRLSRNSANVSISISANVSARRNIRCRR